MAKVAVRMRSYELHPHQLAGKSLYEIQAFEPYDLIT